MQIFAVVGRDAGSDHVCANVSYVSMESAHASFSRVCEGHRGLSCSLRRVAPSMKQLTISVE
jgi:hypothetical protein